MADDLQVAGPRLKTLKNGAVYDLDKGRIVSGQGITTKITAENSNALNRRRREKASALIRAQIIAANNDPNSNMTQVISAAGGVANAAGALWSEIVLDPNAYPRDRVDAWERIAKHAAVLGDAKQTEAEQSSITTQQLGGVIADALIALRDKMQTRQQQQDAENIEQK